MDNCEKKLPAKISLLVCVLCVEPCHFHSGGVWKEEGEDTAPSPPSHDWPLLMESGDPIAVPKACLQQQPEYESYVALRRKLKSLTTSPGERHVQSAGVESQHNLSSAIRVGWVHICEQGDGCVYCYGVRRRWDVMLKVWPSIAFQCH